MIIVNGKPLPQPGRYEPTGREGIGGILPRGSITDEDIAEVKCFFRESFLARIEHFNDTPEGWERRLDRIEPPRFEAREEGKK